MAGLFAVYSLNRRAPEPPSPALQGVDPAIARSITEATEAVRKTPHSGEAWGRLATILGLHDFGAEADICFTQAERFSPNNARWPYLRGLLKSGENPEAALDAFARAAGLSGEMAAPHLRYGEALVERGRIDEAEKQFRFVLQNAPQDGRALLGMGRVALAQRKIQEAKSFLTQSLSNAPTVKATHVLLAQVEQMAGNDPAAEALQQRANDLPEQPEWPDPYLFEANRLRTGKVAAANIAEEMLRKGQIDRARELLENTVRTYPDFSKGWLLFGKALLKQTNAPRAEAAVRRAIELEPASVDARVELGSALFAQGKYTEAEAGYREALAIKPNLAEAWFNLGLAQMNQKNAAAAVASFQKATQYKPDLTYAYIRCGQALGRLNRVPEAIEQLNRALKLNPGNQEAQEMLAILEKFK